MSEQSRKRVSEAENACEVSKAVNGWTTVVNIFQVFFLTGLGVVAVQLVSPCTGKIFFKSSNDVKRLVDLGDTRVTELIESSVRQNHWVTTNARFIYWRLSLSLGQRLLFPVYFQLVPKPGSFWLTTEELFIPPEFIRDRLRAVYEHVFHVDLFLPGDPIGGCAYFDSEQSATRLINDFRVEMNELRDLIVWFEQSASESEVFEELEETAAEEEEEEQQRDEQQSDLHCRVGLESKPAAVAQISSESGLVSLDDDIDVLVEEEAVEPPETFGDESILVIDEEVEPMHGE